MRAASRSRPVVTGYSTAIATIVLGILLVPVIYNKSFLEKFNLTYGQENPSADIIPKDNVYLDRARRILKRTPLIDGHNDFPMLVRQQLYNKIYEHDFQRLGTHTDFNKMKQGLMGGQFWSVFMPCPEDLVPGANLSQTPQLKVVPDLNEPTVSCEFRSRVSLKTLTG